MGHFVYPFRTKTPELIAIVARILGTGASNPTNEFGEGVTITRNGGVGLLRATFAENNGKFMGATADIMPNTLAATTARVVEWDFDSYTGSSPYTLDGMIVDVGINGAPAAIDLAAAQRLFLTFWFRRSGVTG